MKKIIPFLLLFSIQFFVAAQSNMRNAGQYSIAAPAANTTVSTPNTNVVTVNAPANYRQSNVTPSYNQSAPVINSNQYISNSQYVVRSHSRHTIEYAEMKESEKFALDFDFNPLIKNILFPAARTVNKTVVKKPGVLFNSLSDSGSIHASMPMVTDKMNVELSNKGTAAYVQKKYLFQPNKPFRYRCIYGNYSGKSDLGWYSIHVASSKNLDYCTTVTRYMKNRYKLDVFVFEDSFSVNRPYHIVLGKYRKYFVAENILRKIKKEMPGAFVISWNRFSWMIIFE
ncbi:MAG TPA: hypothetical protein PKN48_11430 [Bacteroidales bacterium]|nr:hypothetical protein [Bacteroidales bacterium]